MKLVSFIYLVYMLCLYCSSNDTARQDAQYIWEKQVHFVRTFVQQQPFNFQDVVTWQGDHILNTQVYLVFCD